MPRILVTNDDGVLSPGLLWTVFVSNYVFKVGVEVLFTPADFGALAGRDLAHTTCVVFDVLRATTSMITALANGAEAIIPVAEISEALAIRQRRSDVQPALQFGQRRRIAPGQHFDPAVSEVPGMAGQAQAQRLLARRCAKEHALDATADDEPHADHRRTLTCRR